MNRESTIKAIAEYLEDISLGHGSTVAEATHIYETWVEPTFLEFEEKYNIIAHKHTDIEMMFYKIKKIIDER